MDPRIDPRSRRLVDEILESKTFAIILLRIPAVFTYKCKCRYLRVLVRTKKNAQAHVRTYRALRITYEGVEHQR